jgi:hypothetical protein
MIPGDRIATITRKEVDGAILLELRLKIKDF